MVDTVRSLSALQTLLADNVSGSISAQDLRDFLISAYPEYGLPLASTLEGKAAFLDDWSEGGDTSNAQAIQRALDAHKGSTLVLPIGDYTVDTTILINAQTHLRGRVQGRGVAENRGVVLVGVSGFTGWLLENALITRNPGDTHLYGAHVKDISFTSVTTDAREAKGYHVGQTGEGNCVERAIFYNLNIGLQYDENQLPSDVQSCAFYNSNKGIYYNSCQYSAGARNIICDNVDIMFHVFDTGQNFHLNIEQVHAEQLTNATELILSDNAMGQIHVNCVDKDSQATQSPFAMVRVTRVDAPNSARIKLDGMFSETPGDYILSDDDLGQQWLNSELGLGGHSIYHNINVIKSGEGSAAWKPERSNTTDLEDITHYVNTGDRKVLGFQVWNTTTQKPVYSSGATAGASWKDVAGVTAHTPA